MTTFEQIDTHLKMLSLHQMKEIYRNEAENAAKTKLSYQEFLLRLLEQQVVSKIGLMSRMKSTAPVVAGGKLFVSTSAAANRRPTANAPSPTRTKTRRK